MNSIIFSTLTQNCFNDVDTLLISDIGAYFIRIQVTSIVVCIFFAYVTSIEICKLKHNEFEIRDEYHLVNESWEINLLY